MCKHVAAVLYGVGARLDSRPEVLFTLRGVDHAELIGEAGSAAALAHAGDGAVMDAGELSSVFGIELEPEVPVGEGKALQRGGPRDAESAKVLREAGYVLSEEPTSPHPEKSREFERAGPQPALADGHLHVPPSM